jgi:hypothetical protein
MTFYGPNAPQDVRWICKTSSASRRLAPESNGPRAALLQSLANNLAFVDGNKRVAFASMAIFVRLNGFALRATADDAEPFLSEEVIQARAPLARITAWIEEHLALVTVVANVS